MGSEYCTYYDLMTFCRFFAPSQQVDCKGYARGNRNHCRWWMNHGGGVYHCTLPEAQFDSLRKLKSTNIEGEQK